MQFLRKAHGEETLGRNLVVQSVQEDGCWWCLDSIVSFGLRDHGRTWNRSPCFDERLADIFCLQPLGHPPLLPHVLLFVG